MRFWLVQDKDAAIVARSPATLLPPPTLHGYSKARGLTLTTMICLCVTGCIGDPPPGHIDLGEELPGGETTNTLLFGDLALSRPAANITAENERLFYSGNGFFREPWVTAPSSTQSRDGLGPLFNARSCAACHFQDGRGRPPEPDNPEVGVGLLYRISAGYDDNDLPLPDANYGGQLQPFAISGVEPEGNVWRSESPVTFVYPDGAEVNLQRPNLEFSGGSLGALNAAAVLSPRVAPAMHGLGLLEAITEERLAELSDPEDEDGDGVSGRIRRLPASAAGPEAPGRFGWKCETRSVREQTAGAFLGDMGLSTEVHPQKECTPAERDCLAAQDGGEPEVGSAVFEAIVRYGRLLAVPARDRAADPDILWGKTLFERVGCSTCHVPHHQTGEHELAELSGQDVFPYTDLLLHDMGPALADGEGNHPLDGEWRTAPLWGLRFYEAVNGHNRLLHDGRARGVEEAILWHEGEAKRSRNHFARLLAAERQAIVNFVLSL